VIVTLGIDPSLTATAVCRMVDGEVDTFEEFKPKVKGEERLDWLFTKVSGMTGDPFGGERPPITLIAIEGYAYSRPNQAHQMGELGGVLRLLLHWVGHSWIEVAPSALKKFATGQGNADKDQVMLQVYKRWGFEAPTNNVADAFVLAKIAYHLASNDRYNYTTRQGEVLEKLRPIYEGIGELLDRPEQLVREAMDVITHEEVLRIAKNEVEGE